MKDSPQQYPADLAAYLQPFNQQWLDMVSCNLILLYTMLRQEEDHQVLLLVKVAAAAHG